MNNIMGNGLLDIFSLHFAIGKMTCGRKTSPFKG